MKRRGGEDRERMRYPGGVANTLEFGAEFFDGLFGALALGLKLLLLHLLLVTINTSDEMDD